MRCTPPLLILPLFLALLSSCELPRGSRPNLDEMVRSRPIAVPGAPVLWEIVRLELTKAGLHLDEEKTSEEEGVFETHWVEDLAPYRFRGIRTKVVGRIVPEEDASGRYRVYLATWVQRNADLEAPLESRRAVWQDVERDEARSRMLIYLIESHFAK